MKITRLLVLVFLVSLIFACKDKNTETDYRPNLNTAYNNTLAEDIYADVCRVIFQTAYDSALHVDGQKEIFGATVFYDQYPDSVIIRVHYPDWNVQCPDGLLRSGQYRLDVNKPLSDSSAHASLTFFSYRVEYHRVEGSGTIDNMGAATNGNITFDANFNSNRIYMPDSIRSFSWNSQKSVAWVSGYQSLQNFEDDVFEISGSSNGVSTSGISFQTQTASPIGVYSGCKWLHGGDCQILTPELEVGSGTLKFDDQDSCNYQFEIYYNGIKFFEDFIHLYIPPEFD